MFNLMCVHPFGNYAKGQMITDPDEVAKLQEDREHHFVRIARSEPELAPVVDESKPSKASKVF